MKWPREPSDPGIRPGMDIDNLLNVLGFAVRDGFTVVGLFGAAVDGLTLPFADRGDVAR